MTTPTGTVVVTPATGDPAEEVRRIIEQQLASKVEDALLDWALTAGNDTGRVAFAYGQVLSELEPLDDPIVNVAPSDHDPESRSGFQGLASEAWMHLAPGDYRAETTIDGQVAILRVTGSASTVISPPVTAEQVATAARYPNPAAEFAGARTGEPTMSSTEPGVDASAEAAPPAPTESVAPDEPEAAAPEATAGGSGRSGGRAQVAPPGIRVTINGNLATEPTYGVTDSGRSWARLRVASNERVHGPEGWTYGPPEYTEVVMFGKAAENVVNTLSIGDPVIVKGRPEVDQFTRRGGEPGAALKVFASSVVPNVALTQQRGQAPERAADRTLGPAPTIEHGQDRTIAVGVGRDNKDLQGLLKDNGFKWSAKNTAWYLPSGMPVDERSAAVASVKAGAADRGLQVSVEDPGSQPGPNTGTPGMDPVDPNRSPDVGM